MAPATFASALRIARRAAANPAVESSLAATLSAA
jgi:hypothetical protein